MSCLPQSKSSARLTMELQGLCIWPNDEITGIGIVIVLRSTLLVMKRFHVMTWACEEPRWCSETGMVGEQWADL
jgi:hypothetical protein